MTSHRSAALALATALMASHAGAAPLYDNGSADRSNGLPISGDVAGTSSTTADNFALATNASIDGVGFYFSNYRGTSGWNGLISYAFLADDGGKPGAVLASGQGKDVTILPGSYPFCCGTGTSGLVEFTLQTPFDVLANTSYWLRLGGAGNNTPWWVTSGQGNAYSNGVQGGVDMAFYLNGIVVAPPAPVPEPASLGLMGLGLAALGLRRRARRS